MAGPSYLTPIFDHSILTSGCVDCHEVDRPTMTRLHGATSDTAGHFETTDCLSCHDGKDDSHLKFVFAHFPILNLQGQTSCSLCHEAARPTTGHYANQDCVDCHRDQGGSWTTTSPHPTNTSLTSCNNCHQTARPKGGHYVTKDCASCHRPKSQTLSSFLFSHSNYANQNIQFCLPCHYQKGLSEHKSSSSVKFTGDGNCYNCHKKRRSFEDD